MIKKKSVKSLLLLLILFIIFGSSFSIYVKVNPKIYHELSKGIGLNEVIASAEQGKTDLIRAKDLTMSGDYNESLRLLEDGKKEFSLALEKLEEIDFLYTRYIPFTPGNTGMKILNSTIEGAQAMIYLNHVLWTLTTELNIGKAVVSLENTAIAMQRIEDNLAGINLLFLPADIQKKISELLSYFDVVFDLRQLFLEHVDSIYRFCGMEEAYTYAVALQNTAEARATGGFIGSIVLFTMQGGIVTNWELIDTHLLDFQGGSYRHAPEYLHYIDRVALQEANYTPDIRMSGERIRYFLEEQGGPTVQAVIFIDDKIIPFFLDLIGEIRIPDLPVAINSKNYFDFIQIHLEKRNVLRQERVKNPKLIFFEIVKQIQEKVFNLKPTYEQLEALKGLVEKKHIQVYVKDAGLEKLALDLGFSGYFPTTKDDQDFLGIFHSTFFNKSNRYMDDTILHTTSLAEGKDILNTLMIKRKHNYENKYIDELISEMGVEFDEPSQMNEMLDILGRGDNQSLVRVYVPKGSTLLSSTGISNESIYIGEELDKTFFAFPLEVRAYEEKNISLEYKLPFKLNDLSDYSIYILKQPGIDNLFYTKELLLLDSKNNQYQSQEIYDYLTNDVIISSYFTNKNLWINNQLMMQKEKVKSVSRLKMSIEQEFMPMLLQ